MQKVNLGKEITVGISAYGNIQATKICLDCLFASAEGDFELILVDDCSPDGGRIFDLYKQTSRLHDRTRIFRFDRNLEYSGSLNCILSHASGEKILFISNDIYVTPGYLSELLAVADLPHNIGIVRGVSNFVDNSKTSHNLAMPGPVKGYQDILNFSSQLLLAKRGTFFFEEYLTGDAFLVNKSVIDKIGTYDPIFFGYFADHDFGARAIKAGFQLAVASGAFAYHHRSANFEYLDETNKQNKLRARWAKVFENWARFKLKYGLPVERMYTSVNDINWEDLKNCDVKVYVAPADYSEFEVELAK